MWGEVPVTLRVAISLDNYVGEGEIVVGSSYFPCKLCFQRCNSRSSPSWSSTFIAHARGFEFGSPRDDLKVIYCFTRNAR